MMLLGLILGRTQDFPETRRWTSNCDIYRLETEDRQKYERTFSVHRGLKNCSRNFPIDNFVGWYSAWFQSGTSPTDQPDFHIWRVCSLAGYPHRSHDLSEWWWRCRGLQISGHSGRWMTPHHDAACQFPWSRRTGSRIVCQRRAVGEIGQSPKSSQSNGHLRSSYKKNFLFGVSFMAGSHLQAIALHYSQLRGGKQITIWKGR